MTNSFDLGFNCLRQQVTAGKERVILCAKPLTCWILFGPHHEKTCLRWFANNKGANQPAHMRRLISAVVIRLLESIISLLSSSEISIFQLVCVDEETGLKLALLETPKTGFLAKRPIY